MNTTDPQGDLLQPRTSTGLTATVEDLQARFQQLQTLFAVALAAIVLMSVFTCAFIGKQWRMVRAQVEEQRPAVQKMMVDYQKSTEPLIRSFTDGLKTFAARNRDFQPIIDKYREALRPYLGSTQPGSVVPAQSNQR